MQRSNGTMGCTTCPSVIYVGRSHYLKLVAGKCVLIFICVAKTCSPGFGWRFRPLGAVSRDSDEDCATTLHFTACVAPLHMSCVVRPVSAPAACSVERWSVHLDTTAICSWPLVRYRKNWNGTKPDSCRPSETEPDRTGPDTERPKRRDRSGTDRSEVRNEADGTDGETGTERPERNRPNNIRGR